MSINKKKKKKVAKKKVAKKKVTKTAKKTTKKNKKKYAKKTTSKVTKRLKSSPQTPIVQMYSKDYQSKHFFNRDIGWLDFNARVLHEALDERTPLLERLRFMNIWRSNNDEFFMKRVGALRNKIEMGDLQTFISGHSASTLFEEVRKKVQGQQNLISKAFDKMLIPALQKEGIRLVKYCELNARDKREMVDYFKQNIFPILTPLAVDSGHPFPFISNLSKSIGVCLRKPRERAKRFARVKVPSEIPQWIRLKGNSTAEFRFINIEEVIMANLSLLFSGMKIINSCLFRVTRNAAIDEEGDDAEDKLEWVEEGLKERKFAPVVRLEVMKGSDPWIVQFLIDELDIEKSNQYTISSFPSFTNFSEIIDIKRKKLKFKSFQSRIPEFFDHKADGDFNIFSMIRKKDTLVHFPYESFSHSVENLVKTAANDPKVRGIKIILYRTDTDGRLIDALIEAAENKKQVAVIIELKARFDEERNIQWAQKLEEAGIHVSYGLMDLKTHAKMIMVVRQDSDRVRTYANIGTGNYNSQTSRLYTDYSLFTCDSDICHEVMEAFNYLTGRSNKKDYDKLLVAPYTMFKKFINMIEQEKKNALAGKEARIVAKMNQLEEPEIIEALYSASQAGVKITLLIRGFCCLKPGVPGLSDNIEVLSIVGRLLEHSRIFYFRAGAKKPSEGEFFIGSADWMHRNLFDRVEVIAPINQKNLKEELWDYLELTMSDNRHMWELQSNGEYIQRKANSSKEEINSQSILIKN